MAKNPVWTTNGLATWALVFLTIWVGLVALPAYAQEPGSGETLRERLKQRWTQSQQGRAASPDGAPSMTSPGDYQFSMAHGGLTRLYRVHVPASYRAASPAPLLMAFHGGGGDMNYQANDTYYGLISLSQAKGAVLVFPNGFSKLRSGKLATWNAGNCCADARDKDIDDVGFVRQILAEVTRQLSIDRQRVYATGMSNGAMMAYRLACEMPDTFKAIAAVAGTDNTQRCTPTAPVSVLHIHAQNDDRVLFNGGAGEAFRSASKVTDFTSVPATVAAWVQRNRCEPTPQRVLQTAGAFCDSYTGCAGQTEVKLCVTESGGHSWPGGSKPRGNEPASQAISANEVMWSFFASQPVNR
jgi:polyhydroxybutyrate depolymerase